MLGSEAFMRFLHLLLGGLVLGVVACGGKVNHAPPPLKKELLIGKWKHPSDARLITGYQFAEDGTFEMTVKGVDKKVPGKFNWTGDRSLELVYKDTPQELKKAYAEAAKAFREDIKQRVKDHKLNDRAAPSILSAIEDELPNREEFQVSISEQPRELNLIIPESGATQRFDKAD